MRIDNLSEDKIRLLRDIIKHQIELYDDINLKRKEAQILLDNLSSAPSFIATIGNSGMMTDIMRQCNNILHPNPYLGTNSVFLKKDELIEILGSYDPQFIDDLFKSIDLYWPFEAPKVDNFHTYNDSKSTNKIFESEFKQLGIKAYPKLPGLVGVYNKIILHIPHSSCNFDFAGQEQYVEGWRNRAKPLIDWCTDELFTPYDNNEEVIPVVFDTCRTLVDVERMCCDPLEVRGLGITYYPLLETEENGFKVSRDERIRYQKKYLDHQHKLAHLLLEHNFSLMIDCHSFSSRPTILQPDISKNQDVDICIGFNEDRTKPDETTLALVAQHFIEKGYKVAFNTPFSNSKTVETPAKYTSLMIEVNKSLYMDEDTLEKKDSFLKVRDDITSLYAKLL